MEPKVSVCIPTYQHAAYISQCLDGVLMQKTDFEYEILVGEDDSKDGTREICIQYAEKYPEKIRLFLNDRENVIYIAGRPTGRWNFINLLTNAKGTYIAICEGDDYWTNRDKLQRQVDFLEENKNYSLCFHNSIVIYENQKKAAHLFIALKDGDYALEDIIERRWFVPTQSIVFRLECLEMPKWIWHVFGLDFALLLILAKNGKVKYFSDVMGVYRIREGSASAGRTRQFFGSKIMETLTYFNMYTDFKYNGNIQSRVENIIEDLTPPIWKKALSPDAYYFRFLRLMRILFPC